MIHTRWCGRHPFGNSPRSDRTANNDNDDNDTQRSPSNCRERSDLTGVSAGVTTPRKSVGAGVTCAIGKVCTCTQVNDSAQYVESR